MTDSLSELITRLFLEQPRLHCLLNNDEAVNRTAPATPGLLITLIYRVSNLTGAPLNSPSTRSCKLSENFSGNLYFKNFVGSS